MTFFSQNRDNSFVFFDASSRAFGSRGVGTGSENLSFEESAREDAARKALQVENERDVPKVIQKVLQEHGVHVHAMQRLAFEAEQRVHELRRAAQSADEMDPIQELIKLQQRLKKKYVFNLSIDGDSLKATDITQEQGFRGFIANIGLRLTGLNVNSEVLLKLTESIQRKKREVHDLRIEKARLEHAAQSCKEILLNGARSFFQKLRAEGFSSAAKQAIALTAAEMAKKSSLSDARLKSVTELLSDSERTLQVLQGVHEAAKGKLKERRTQGEERFHKVFGAQVQELQAIGDPESLEFSEKFSHLQKEVDRWNDPDMAMALQRIVKELQNPRNLESESPAFQKIVNQAHSFWSVFSDDIPSRSELGAFILKLYDRDPAMYQYIVKNNIPLPLKEILMFLCKGKYNAIQLDSSQLVQVTPELMINFLTQAQYFLSYGSRLESYLKIFASRWQGTKVETLYRNFDKILAGEAPSEAEGITFEASERHKKMENLVYGFWAAAFQGTPQKTQVDEFLRLVQTRYSQNYAQILQNPGIQEFVGFVVKPVNPFDSLNTDPAHLIEVLEKVRSFFTVLADQGGETAIREVFQSPEAAGKNFMMISEDEILEMYNIIQERKKTQAKAQAKKDTEKRRPVVKFFPVPANDSTF